MTSIHERARLFESLHTPESPLALANAWDVASARLVEAAGAAAVATTSAGVAWSLGAPDGNALDRDLALALIGRIVAAVSVPVTADIESGFAESAAGVAETIAGVVQAGAVGVNIEDAVAGRLSPLRPVDEQAERIAAARGAADELGVPLYINVRIDTYLRSVGDPSGRLAETLNRAEAYLSAGASGVFVPAVVDLPTISELAASIPAPLNVLAGPGAPSVAELSAAGVARVSLGSWVAETAYAVARRAAEELFAAGTYEAVSNGLSYAELNALLRR